MTPLKRTLAAAFVSGACLALTEGCTLTDNSHSDQDCSARDLDVRTPLTRADVGLESGERSVSWACDDGLDLTVQLPEGVTLALDSRRVTFSTYGLDAGSRPPQGVDVQSTYLSVDDAAALATRIAAELSIDQTEIDSWRTEAQSAPDEGLDVKTPFLKGGAGDVKADLQVIRQSVSGDSNVHLILYLDS